MYTMPTIKSLPPHENARQNFSGTARPFLSCPCRYSRTIASQSWILLSANNADTVAREFLSAWVSRFGVPAAITTDQGRQFTSDLWRSLSDQLGMNLQFASAHHPQTNAKRWTDSLPLVLLGIRSAVRQDIQHSSAELVYGCALRLPGALFSTEYHLRQHVGLRADEPALHPVYDGPFSVLSRTPKTVTIAHRGKPLTVNIDRIKPALYTEPPISDRNMNVTFSSAVDVVR
uniref:Integrase catalytic domain-containing protein n=1 Tax=Trichuris muris TaxID=70415 RepID=A0A5S6QL35_TRIMR